MEERDNSESLASVAELYLKHGRNINRRVNLRGSYRIAIMSPTNLTDREEQVIDHPLLLKYEIKPFSVYTLDDNLQNISMLDPDITIILSTGQYCDEYANETAFVRKILSYSDIGMSMVVSLENISQSLEYKLREKAKYQDEYIANLTNSFGLF